MQNRIENLEEMKSRIIKLEDMHQHTQMLMERNILLTMKSFEFREQMATKSFYDIPQSEGG